MLTRMKSLAALRLPIVRKVASSPSSVVMSLRPQVGRCLSTGMMHNSGFYRSISMLSPPERARIVPSLYHPIPSIRKLSTVGPADNISNPELYTETAFASLSRLPVYANTYQTQYVEVPHLLKSMFDEGPDGLMQNILNKSGITSDNFEK